VKPPSLDTHVDRACNQSQPRSDRRERQYALAIVIRRYTLHRIGELSEVNGSGRSLKTHEPGLRGFEPSEDKDRAARQIDDQNPHWSGRDQSPRARERPDEPCPGGRGLDPRMQRHEEVHLLRPEKPIAGCALGCFDIAVVPHREAALLLDYVEPILLK